MNINAMLEQARQMQQKLQQEMEQIHVEGSAGGGLVKVRMSGLKAVTKVEIDSSLMREGDNAMLEDLMLAACHDASRRCEEAVREKLGPLASGLGLPGLG
jgi:hypothetical protein